MKLAVISFTVEGSRVNETLVSRFRQLGEECTGYIKTRFADEVRPLGLVPVEGSLAEWTGRTFDRVDGLIFIGAAGIAVRAIAPFLKDKMTDPAVVVIDEMGRFSISLLSGHVGGANDLARQAAGILGATPVVTTATDIRRRFAVDVFARKHGLVIQDRQQAKMVSADLLNGIPVGFFSDIPMEGPLPEGFTQREMCRRSVWITWKCRPEPEQFCSMFLEGAKEILKLVPKILVVGIGCRKGTPKEQIIKAVRLALEEENCMPEAVAAVASVDLKKEEPGLLAAADWMQVPFHTYSAEELKAVPGAFEESGFVQSVTGVGNVCQRAAMAVAGAENGIETGAESGAEIGIETEAERARLVKPKTVYDGVTIAIARKPLKKILLGQDLVNERKEERQ